MRFVLANAQLFLNSSSDLRLLRPILAAAAAGRSGPGRARNCDATPWTLRIEPLFDGAELERI